MELDTCDKHFHRIFVHDFKSIVLQQLFYTCSRSTKRTNTLPQLKCRNKQQTKLSLIKTWKKATKSGKQHISWECLVKMVQFGRFFSFLLIKNGKQAEKNYVGVFFLHARKTPDQAFFPNLRRNLDETSQAYFMFVVWIVF